MAYFVPKASRPFSNLVKALVPRPSGINALLQQTKKEKVVVVGSGWAGYKLTSSLDKKKYEVVLISPNNYFTFTPLLPSTSVGTLEFRSAIEPVRSTENLSFIQAFGQEIDFVQKMVKCKSAITKQSFDVSYDKLVIACGASSNTFNIPGVLEHANFLKDITHARKIRQKLIENFEIASDATTTNEERKRLLNFVIVGGGPTGVEFCAELHDFITDDISKIYPSLLKDVHITLYDVAPKILPTFNDSLSMYAMKQFTKRGINVETGQAVVKVEEDRLHLKSGLVVPYGLLLWSTGLAPNELIKGINLPKDRMKRLITNEDLKVLDNENVAMPDVYAIGDCAVIEGYDLPCTAQVAKQKAEYLTKQLNAASSAYSATSSKAQKRFLYKHRGSMAYIGDWKAVVDMTGNGGQQSGLLGWLIWRSAYVSMASFRNKVKIPTYW